MWRSAWLLLRFINYSNLTNLSLYLVSRLISYRRQNVARSGDFFMEWNAMSEQYTANCHV